MKVDTTHSHWPTPFETDFCFSYPSRALTWWLVKPLLRVERSAQTCVVFSAQKIRN